MVLKQQWIYNNVYFVTLVLLLAILKLVTSQTTYLHSCNDPLIVEHIVTFGHTYCAHACRPGAEADGMCSATGNCVCSPPCSNKVNMNSRQLHNATTRRAMVAMATQTAATPPIIPSNDICPPSTGNPPDPDPTFSEANCLASCANECAGGTGLRCEEVPTAPLPPNILGNICTCTCPTVLCGATQPPGGGVTPGNSTASIPLFKFPLILLKKKKKKIWIILKKIWLCCFIFAKLFALKSLALALYFLIFWDYIDWDLRLLVWFLTRALSTIF